MHLPQSMQERPIVISNKPAVDASGKEQDLDSHPAENTPPWLVRDASHDGGEPAVSASNTKLQRTRAIE